MVSMIVDALDDNCFSFSTVAFGQQLELKQVKGVLGGNDRKL